MKTLTKKSEKHQRIELILQAISVGGDWQIILKGGREHIGGVALARSGYKTQVAGFSDHKESPVAEELAGILAEELNCHIAFSCGIHYDNISRDEISEVLALGRSLIDEFINSQPER